MQTEPTTCVYEAVAQINRQVESLVVGLEKQLAGVRAVNSLVEMELTNVRGTLQEFQQFDPLGWKRYLDWKFKHAIEDKETSPDNGSGGT